jgi:hypothetical protein
MNYAFNKIKFNRQVVSYLAAQGKKKYTINQNKNHNKIITRNYSQQIPNKDPDKDPFPSWTVIAILSGLGLYHQYKNQIKRE